jgi:hypothetical protein
MGSQCCRDSNTISAEEQLVVTFGSPGDAGEGSSLANRKLFVVAKESASLDPLESPTSPISVVFPETPKKPEPALLEIAEPRAKELLEELRPLVEDFRILDAEELVAAKAGDFTAAEWRELQQDPAAKRFFRARANVQVIGRACTSIDLDWVEVFADHRGTKVEVFQSPGERFSFVYRAVVPALGVSLSQLMSLANETDHVRDWQKILAHDPVKLGKRKAQLLCTYQRVKVMGGMIKVDFAQEIQRFVDVENGMMVEYINTIDPAKSDPEIAWRYVQPSSEYRRLKVEVKQIWLCLGESNVVVVQVNRVDTPIPLTKWLLSAVGYVVGKQVAAGILDNIPLATNPDLIWAARQAEDRDGLYALLDRAARSPAAAAHKEKFLPSLLSAEKKLPADASEYIARLFDRRRKYDRVFERLDASAASGEAPNTAVAEA